MNKGSSQEDIYMNKYLTYKAKYLKLKSTIDKKSIIMSGGSSTKSKNTLYLFKADWCPHCINFLPTWENIKNNNEDKINFIKYDSQKNRDQIKEFGVEGFPTIILKVGDKAIEYVGPRDETSILNFIKQYN